MEFPSHTKQCLPDSDGIDSTPGEAQPPGETALDQFIACFAGLEDPRTGNAGLHLGAYAD
jgi:hypothetical protein